MDCVIDEQTTVSDLIRESVIDKLNKLKKDEQFGGQIQMMDEDTDWSKLV